MSRRLKPTLIDYVVIAINPALIMVLVGSLIYFLLEMFYQGQFPERLHFCLTMFIFAAVLVSRISMEEGWEHAMPFGVALGLAICLAMHKFVKYPPDSSLAELGWIINYSLIALIWWCAYQLTWDCTMIDETQDASGEGLLQSTGLDSEETVVEKDDSAATKAKDELEKQAQHAADDADWARVVQPTQPLNQPTAKNRTTTVTTKKHSNQALDDSLIPAAKDEASKSWWQKMVERRRRPHAPGVWVVYFSLAALPLFGLGQALIPLANTASRRYAFVLLCVYVASGLGLLLTTSFLGLRRYLRQRRLEMPAAMAGTWLVTGALLIIGLIGITAMLPRPNAEYEISQLPTVGSEPQESNSTSVGNEGTKDDQAKTAPGTNSRPEKDQPSDSQSDGKQTGQHPEGRDTTKTSGTKPGDGGSKQSTSGEPKSGQQNNQQSGEKSDSEKSQSSSSQQASDNSKQQSSDSKNQSSDDKSQSNGSGDRNADAKNQSGESKNSQSSNDQNSNAGKQAPTPSEQNNSTNSQQPESQTNPQTPETPNLSLVGETVSKMFKWVFYGVVILVALFAAWRYWAQVINWIGNFLLAIREFWAKLFGGGRDDGDGEDTAKPAAKLKSFFEYPDPFASGIVSRMTPVELTRYSFEALEAWARDNGMPRETDQTAFEFAQQIGQRAEHLAAPVRMLAEMYSRAAYARGTLTAASVEHLRTFWTAIMQADRVSA